MNLAYQILDGFIFVCQKSLKRTFQPVFECKIFFGKKNKFEIMNIAQYFFYIYLTKRFRPKKTNMIWLYRWSFGNSAEAVAKQQSYQCDQGTAGANREVSF